MVAEVANDPFMSALTNANVSFLDDSIFDVRINLARRRLIRIPKAERRKPESIEVGDEESYGLASLWEAGFSRPFMANTMHKISLPGWEWGTAPHRCPRPKYGRISQP
jgi:hypothetical protein